MDMFEKIVDWNEERGLIKQGFNHEKEISFIIEELLESTGNYNSESAQVRAQNYAQEIMFGAEHNKDNIIDAMGDIIVFATGAIAKNGYNPSLVMEEIYKEINSRKGLLVSGKFVKNSNAERYYANFSHCKNNQSKNDNLT